MNSPATRPMGQRQQRSRERILSAGVRLFAAYGVRRTTMEALAAEAGVAKATAYAQFPHKEAVFAAVVEHVTRGMMERAEAAAVAAPGPVEAVLASLTTKQLEMFTLVHRSPHAAELLSALSGEGKGPTDAAHAAYQRSLAKWLVRCPGVGKRLAPELAELLDQAAYGIAGRVESEAALERGLKLLVERVAGQR